MPAEAQLAPLLAAAICDRCISQILHQFVAGYIVSTMEWPKHGMVKAAMEQCHAVDIGCVPASEKRAGPAGEEAGTLGSQGEPSPWLPQILQLTGDL
jgi:hypothetical protein